MTDMPEDVLRKAQQDLARTEHLLVQKARQGKNCYYEAADVAYAYQALLQAKKELGHG